MQAGKDWTIQDLTIAIPCKNSGEKLRDCLNQIGKGFAKKIVIIESENNIESREIADEHGAELLLFNWNGHYPKKRNWFLLNHKPSTKWVLFLDDDEWLTEKAKEALTVAMNQTTSQGFWLKYSIYIGGKKLKFGYPLYKLALFQPEAGLYEKLEEDHWSNLDMEIHEHPILDGPVDKVKTEIEHRVNLDQNDWKIKHEKYAIWEAKRYFQLSQTKNQTLTPIQKIKYFILQTPFSGMFFFTGSYIIMGGILDGRKGFKYAYMKASYFQSISKEIKKQKNN
jgi:glycosyltransferase involved in cell wall biosynthesis